MRIITLLALLPFLALSFDAHAKKVATAPAEDALQLPWENFVREANPPVAAVQLLATLHVGSRIDTFSVPLAKCGDAIQAVQFKITGADVTVASFGVKFTDNTTRDFNVNKTFKAGTDSGWIDLSLFKSMDQRCPAAIYAKGNSAGNATVLVYGNLK